jgi:hypothetical protein
MCGSAGVQEVPSPKAPVLILQTPAKLLFSTDCRLSNSGPYVRQPLATYSSQPDRQFGKSKEGEVENLFAIERVDQQQ